MRALLRDLRYAVRVLVDTPTYTVVAVLTLGLAIGATTAIFSVVDATLLRPFPYKDAGRLVEIWESAPDFEHMSVCYPDFQDWQKQTKSLSSIGAARDTNYTLTGGQHAERLRARQLSASMLPTLGVEPVLGRNFTTQEDTLEGPYAVILGNGYWNQHMGRDPNVLGKTMMLSGQSHTIVGVLPADFHFDSGLDVYTPLGKLPMSQRERGNHPGIFSIARMNPGVTLAQVRDDMHAVGLAIAAVEPKDTNVFPTVEMMQVNETKNVRGPLTLLMGAVIFVLFIAVANIANLTLARGTRRAKEMAIRAALGAGRGALIRQLLVESTLLGLLGGALGAVLALWGVDLLAAARPDSLPTEAVISMNPRALAFTMVVSVVAGILFGLYPALQASRIDLNRALKDGERGTTGGQGRARSVLVIAEVALALVLLVGAGLSIRAISALESVDVGFQPGPVLAGSLALPASRYSTPEELISFYDQLQRGLEAVPGVESATIAAGMPFRGAPENSFEIEGRPKPPPGEGLMTVMYPVDAHYARTMGLQLVAGRLPDEHDAPTGQKVVVIDEVLARTHFPAGALGQHIDFGDHSSSWEIIGVVRHVVNYGLGEHEPAADQIYVLWTQIPKEYIPMVLRGVEVVVRAREGVDPTSLAPAITARLASIDPELPLYGTSTLAATIDDSLGPRRFTKSVLAIFAALALLLAVIGLYSVMSYAVAQRRHEIGVRMALGAQPNQVLRLVVAQGVRLVGIGLCIGVAGALALGSFLESIVVGISPTDPVTFILVGSVLMVVALAASYLPARRAARVDPMVALRTD